MRLANQTLAPKKQFSFKNFNRNLIKLQFVN